MRSVYAKILLWCFATLVLSMVALTMVSRFVFYEMVGQGSFFDRINALLLEQASEAYEAGGAPALTARLERAGLILRDEQHLIDRQGKDLASGADLSALAAQFQFEKGSIQNVGGRIAAGVASKDGRYRLLVLADPPMGMVRYIPYYLPIPAAVALLCWALASRIASPLRALARTVERFGRGDLSARVNSRRRDEIGELGAAFDRMAERIGTLLTAERRLLQDISHELRSPLARLSFAAELARTADDRDAAVRRLKKEIGRLTDLVGALLQATQTDGDSSSFTPQRVDVGEILREVVEDCRLEADAGRSEIVLKAGSCPPLDGDPELLRRAIENVVRNAIRYTPAQSTVEVDLNTTDHAMTISVRDSGPGVPKEALEKIFLPFYRVDDSRNGSTGGVGLGLTIAQRAISLHHGRVWAENANPGLRVCIELPVEVAERIATPRDESRGSVSAALPSRASDGAV